MNRRALLDVPYRFGILFLPSGRFGLNFSCLSNFTVPSLPKLNDEQPDRRAAPLFDMTCYSTAKASTRKRARCQAVAVGKIEHPRTTSCPDKAHA